MYEGGTYITSQGFIFEVYECDMGYHLTLYDSDLKEMDGGLLETDDWKEESFVVTEGLALCGCSDTKWWDVNTVLQKYYEKEMDWADYILEHPEQAVFYIQAFVNEMISKA